MEFFLLVTTQQITRDLDDNRVNEHPCIISSPIGQLFIFYRKTWVTGKLSYTRVTFSPPFTVSIESGNGVLKGTSVTWDAITLEASPSTYQLIYVTTDGVVHIGLNLSMTEMRNVIPLAYVQSGATSISRIEELEKTGNYIFIRKQVDTGSGWVWDDYEYRLNTGDQPRAFYDSVSNKIYMSYKKDGIAYNRVLDPTNELTWEYLPNVTIQSNNITLNRDPQNSSVLSISSGYNAPVLLLSDEYPILSTGFCYIGNQVYIFLPYIGGSYLQYAYGPLTYEVLTYNGGNSYTVEATYVIPAINYGDANYRYRLWVGTIGVKYIRIRTETRIVVGEFVTYPVNYASVLLYDYPALISLEPYNETNDIYMVDTRDNKASATISAGYNAPVIKTSEFIESRTFQSDISDPLAISAGYNAPVIKTTEFIESRTFQNDTSDPFAISAGYKIYSLFTNI